MRTLKNSTMALFALASLAVVSQQAAEAKPHSKQMAALTKAPQSRLFDWRDYAYVAFDITYLDTNDTPTDLMSTLGPRERAAALRKRENEKLLVRQMDQLSLIRRVQQAVMKGSQTYSALLASDPDAAMQAVEPYGKIRIELGDEHSHFTPHYGKVVLDPAEIVNSSYESAVGIVPASLAGAMVHEFSHAGDKSLTVEKSLAEARDAMADAAKKKLRQYPEWNGEYTRTGKIAGVPLQKMFQAKSYAEFNFLYTCALGLTVVPHKIRNVILAAVAGPLASNVSASSAGYRMLKTLDKTYQAKLEENIFELDEKPAITEESDVTGSVWNAPRRINYEMHTRESDDDTPSLLLKMYADIPTSADGLLAPTRYCKNIKTCAARHIEGATLRLQR